jgi:two-component system, CitB family, sensor kinase
MIFTIKRMKLFNEMVLLISAVIAACAILSYAVFTTIIDDVLTQYIGQEAMIVAKLAANDQEIVHAFDTKDPPKEIQSMAETIRKLTGASYVVIGNKDGMRYSHPDPTQIGKHMGTSNEPVFEEHESVIYRGDGISGPAIKAKTPIYNSKGEIIGVSSVGFLDVDIREKIFVYRREILELAFLLLLMGITAAFFVAKRIKKKIFGLEPDEISFLFKEKEATFESIHEGIVAVDNDCIVITMNKKARELWSDIPLTKGVPIQHSILKEIIQEVIQTKSGSMNQNIILGGQLYVIDLSPITENDIVRGVVLTLRTELEVEQLFKEVSKIKSYSENIRSLNHEFLNKLNTIYGLLSINQYDKAMELISEEVKERQDIIVFLISSVKDPFLVACLLGKIQRAKEVKVELEIDQESELTQIPSSLDTRLLVTILGNIIDNAIEAAKRKNKTGAIVKVSFTDIGRNIIFDIQDNGTGVSNEQQMEIFVEGYTTKSDKSHGIGLTIVKNSLERLNGQLYIADSSLGGAKFTIVIPKDNLLKISSKEPLE